MSGYPYVGLVRTPEPVVPFMVSLADVTKDDVVYDLGCGQAEVLISAAGQHGCRCVGVDACQEWCEAGVRNVRKAGLEGLITIRHENIFESDFSDATVILMFLRQKIVDDLRPLLNCKPGVRVVSNSYYFHDDAGKIIPPLKTRRFGPYTALHLYATPVGEVGPHPLPRSTP